MKLCLIMASNEEGGLENHFVELANGICQQFELIVIAHKKYINRFEKTITFEELDLSGSRKNPIKLWQLKKIIDKHKPDIIHAHANKATSMLASIRHFISAITIATLHNQKNNVTMFDKMDHVIGVSHAVLKNVFNPNKTVIYNGVASNFFEHLQQLKNTDFGLNGDRPVAISVGRLVKAKGMDILIKAWKNINADLLIIGDGSEKAELERLSKEQGLSGKVQFLGHRKDVGNLINYADLVIIASRREGFSYVCAESLLLNTPVISTDVPVANEVLPKQYIVGIEQIEELNSLINLTFKDLSVIIEDFKTVFNRAGKEFTFDFMLKRTIECYEKCLKN